MHFVLRHTKLISFICVILLVIFVIIIIRSIMGGASSYFTISILGIIAIFIFRAYVISKQKKEIVRCANCKNEMTYGHFKQFGCQKCHTDLYVKTGKYVK